MSNATKRRNDHTVREGIGSAEINLIILRASTDQWLLRRLAFGGSVELYWRIDPYRSADPQGLWTEVLANARRFTSFDEARAQAVALVLGSDWLTLGNTLQL